MERLTRPDGQGGYRLAEPAAVEAAMDRLGAYEDAHERLLCQRARAEEKLDALRGRGKGRTASFQQALAEKLMLTALLDQLEGAPGRPDK